MKGWIDDCQRSHQPCKTPQQVGGPKRLLQCLSDGSVRLVETRSRSQRCDYIALSYCWGDGTAVMKTTEKTLDHHQRGIPDESLPPLFREAVTLARGLNVSYLWIDSLCAIQDSQKDKEEEIMQMCDIIRGALVVVVAATAESPLDSLLAVKPQPGQSHTWRTASRIGHEDMDLDVKFRKRDKRAHSHPNATASTRTGERAWSFQEKLLASRCLVFRDDEVVWECRSCCLCECGGEQEHFSVGNASNSSRLMQPHQQMLLPLAEHAPFQLDGTLRYFADAEAAYSFWETAVNTYSTGALTFRTDRLPAISAVASIIAEATGDRYLAGLWRNDLLAGLDWGAGQVPEARPHHEYIAPTWSWVAQPGGVFYSRSSRTRYSRDADLDASVLEAWTVLKGQNPYGPVSDGAIVLSGLHCDAEMTISENGGIQLDFGHGQVEEVGLVDSTDLLQTLDFMHVEPDTDGDRLGGNSRNLRRIIGWAKKCAACLLWHGPFALAFERYVSHSYAISPQGGGL